MLLIVSVSDKPFALCDGMKSPQCVMLVYISGKSDEEQFTYKILRDDVLRVESVEKSRCFFTKTVKTKTSKQRIKH